MGFCYSRLCFRIIINHTRKERERNVNNTFGGLCFSSARDDDDDFDDDFDDETVLSVVIFAWGGQKDFERFYRRECTASKAT